MVIKSKSRISKAWDQVLLACEVGEMAHVGVVAQIAHCTEAEARRFGSRAVKRVEKLHGYVFRAIPLEGYLRIKGDDAFKRSEAQRRGALRKTDRALRELPAAADGASDAVKPLIANRAQGLVTVRQFLNQRATTPPPRELPRIPNNRHLTEHNDAK